MTLSTTKQDFDYSLIEITTRKEWLRTCPVCKKAFDTHKTMARHRSQKHSY